MSTPPEKIILTMSLSTGDSFLALSVAFSLGLLLKGRYPLEAESLSQHLGVNKVLGSQGSSPDRLQTPGNLRMRILEWVGGEPEGTEDSTASSHFPHPASCFQVDQFFKLSCL